MTDESQRWRADRARDYLEHIRWLSLSMDSRQQEIDALRSKMLQQGIVYSDMPGSPNAYGDAIPDGMAELERLAKSYAEGMKDYVREIEGAHRAIEAVGNPEYRTVLRMRYLNGYTWERTAGAIGYAPKTAKRRGRPALCALYEHLPREWTGIPNAL